MTVPFFVKGALFDRHRGGDILKMKNVASSEKALVAKIHKNTTSVHSLDMEERIIFGTGNNT